MPRNLSGGARWEGGGLAFPQLLIQCTSAYSPHDMALCEYHMLKETNLSFGPIAPPASSVSDTEMNHKWSSPRAHRVVETSENGRKTERSLSGTDHTVEAACKYQ